MGEKSARARGRVVWRAFAHDEAREKVEQQAGRANEVGEQYRVGGEDASLDAVEPNVAAYE